MAFHPPPRRNLRPRNVMVSYKNTCGAAAPMKELTTRSDHENLMLDKPQMVASSTHEGGVLRYTTNGMRLPPGAVSTDIYFSHLLIKGFSGAVVVEMAAPSFFVQDAIKYPCAHLALISEVKSNWD